MNSEEKFIELLGNEDFDSNANKELADTIAKTIDNMVNNFNFHRKELVDKIKDDVRLSRNFLALSVAFVKLLNAYSKHNCLYDGRNEYSVNMASKITLCQRFKELEGLTNYNGFTWYDKMDVRRFEYENQCKLDIAGMIVAEGLKDMHKTLMQTFAGMVFLFLGETEPKLQEEMSQIIGYDEWHRTPFI